MPEMRREGPREPLRIVLGAIPPASLCGNSRAHYMKKYKEARDWRDSGYWHGIVDLIEWRHVPKIRLTFLFRNKRKIDLDNLAIGMKPWVDGLVDAEVIEDDTPEHVSYGSHTFEKGEPGMEILVEER
jgi:hypothetical protein